MIVAFIQAMVQPGSGVRHMRKHTNWTNEVWEIYERITGKGRPETFRAASGKT